MKQTSRSKEKHPIINAKVSLSNKSAERSRQLSPSAESCYGLSPKIISRNNLVSKKPQVCAIKIRTGNHGRNSLFGEPFKSRKGDFSPTALQNATEKTFDPFCNSYYGMSSVTPEKKSKNAGESLSLSDNLKNRLIGSALPKRSEKYSESPALQPQHKKRSLMVTNQAPAQIQKDIEELINKKKNTKGEYLLS